MAEIKLTKENFEEEVLKSNVPVLVDFWATWCGPCQMLAPVIEEVSKELDGIIKVGKVNVDEEPELAARYNVAVIPTLYVFKNGAAVKAAQGYMPKENILRLL